MPILEVFIYNLMVVRQDQSKNIIFLWRYSPNWAQTARSGFFRLHNIKKHTQVPKAVTYAAHNEHKKRKSVLSVGFESAIPTIKRLQTYALHRMANRISYHVAYSYQIST
jgi:hypothetical protein